MGNWKIENYRAAKDMRKSKVSPKKIISSCSLKQQFTDDYSGTLLSY